MRKCLFVLVFAWGTIYGKVWVVDTSGAEGDSLQKYINIAHDSAVAFGRIDTVLVKNGTYHLFFPDTMGLRMRDSVHLISEGGAANCTLTAVSNDGKDTSWHVIFCSNVTDVALIKGFTIRDGHAKGPLVWGKWGTWGAGIFLYASTVVIEDNVIENNFSEGHGAGIFALSSSCVITKNVIRYNIANSGGGGIYIYNNSNLILKENEIYDNIAKGISWGGGGIVVDGSSPYIVGNLILNNKSRRGGGIRIGRGATAFNAAPVIEKCAIAHNIVQEAGAGIFVGGSSQVKIRRCVISLNISDTVGGGISFSGGSPAFLIMDSCLIIDNGNLLNDSSGGVYVDTVVDSIVLNYSNLYYNTLQGDNEINNKSNAIFNLQNNFWWDTTDAEISAKIAGPNIHTPWKNDFIPGVPGEPISVDSVRNYDKNYANTVNILYSPDTLYIRVYGKDRNTDIREAAIVILKSRKIYPTGIAVGLIETDTNSGIYEGKAYLCETKGSDTIRIDDIFQRIRVDTAWDIVKIIANVDTFDTFRIIYKGIPDISTDTACNFGNIWIGDTVEHTFYIKNTGIGIANLRIDSTRNNKSEFVIDIVTPQLVKSGDSISLIVKFIPADTGWLFDTLKIYSDDPDESVFYIYLSGRGVIPDIELSDTFYNFENVWVNDTAWEILWIYNKGNDTLLIDSVISTNYPTFAISGSLTYILPGDSDSICISFVPQDTGIFTGFLKVFSNDPDEPVCTVYLQGRGIIPDIELSDTAYNFGNVWVNDTACWKYLWIYNKGNDTLIIDSLVLKEPIFNLTIFPSKITPHDSDSVDILFIPNDTGTVSDFLKIFSNDPDEPVLSVKLTGRGIIPDIALLSASYDFGDVQITDTAYWQWLWIKNEGNTDLIVDSIISSHNAFLILSPSFPQTISPNNSINVLVGFTPSETGVVHCILSIYSNDPDEPVVYAYAKGRGIGSHITLSDSSHNYGDVWIGDTATWKMWLYNDGNDTLVIDSAILRTSIFFVVDFPSLILPSDSENLIVAFAPKDTGKVFDTLKIYSNDPYNPERKINLYGRGIAGDIELSDTFHDFGQVSLLDTAKWYFYIGNKGNAYLVIDSVKFTSKDYTVISPSVFPQAIGVGDIMFIHIQFVPKDTGAFTCTLKIYSKDPDESVRYVHLRAYVKGARIFTDTLLDFGKVWVDSAKLSYLWIYNKGNENLIIKNILLSDTVSFDFESTLPDTIMPFDSSFVLLYFTPVDTGKKEAILQLISNDPAEPVKEVKIKGYGIIPDIFVKDTAYDYGNVTVGSYKDWTLKILNKGNTFLVIYDVNIADTSAFKLLNICDTVMPHDTAKFTIRFSPPDTGEFISEMIIVSNDPDEETLSVRLKGKGKPILIEEKMPKIFDFTCKPNPFSNFMLIKYQVPTRCRVKIEIYDVVGRCVNVLINKYHEPGYYSIKWQKELPSGVYFCKMRTEKFVKVKKIIKLR